jgi:hypothetical protein
LAAAQAPGSPPEAPSFRIDGASGLMAPPLRLDRINSSQVLQQARQVLFAYLHGGGAAGEPCGVVLQAGGGRVVFDRPLLLPSEQFVPLELLRQRHSRPRQGRLRMPRLE